MAVARSRDRGADPRRGGAGTARGRASPIAVTSGEPSLVDRLLRRQPSLALRLGQRAVDPAGADPNGAFPPQIAAALAADPIAAPMKLFEAVLQEEDLRADFRLAVVLPALAAIALVATAAIAGSGLATLVLAAAALAALWRSPARWSGFERIAQLPVAAALASLGAPPDQLATLVPEWAQPAVAEARRQGALSAVMARLAAVEVATLRGRLRRVGMIAWGGVLVLALMLIQGRSIG
jgi:hypothetical protein